VGSSRSPLADDDGLDWDEFATFVEGVARVMDERAPDVPVRFTFADG